MSCLCHEWQGYFYDVTNRLTGLPSAKQVSGPDIANTSHLINVGTLHAISSEDLHIFHTWLILEIEMKYFVAIFALLTLLGSQIVFADEDKKKKTATETADSAESSTQKESSNQKDSSKQKGSADKKAAEEEPDCD